MSDFQTVQCQFATDDDRGSANANPAAIKRQSFMRLLDNLVIRRIKQNDDFLSFDDRIRNPNLLPETLSQAAGDSRFPIPRRAIQKKPAGRVDCRANHVEEFFGHRYVEKCIVQFLAADRLITDCLRLDGNDIIVQRDRCWSCVGAFGVRCFRTATTFVGQPKDIVIQAGTSTMQHHTFRFQTLH